jgi:hypothetical protein
VARRSRLEPGGIGRLVSAAFVCAFLSLHQGAPAARADQLTVETPRKAVTGQLFTIRPVFPPGMDIAPDVVCRIEFRWGDDKALFSLQSNNTFGGILFEGPASKGFCGEWTLTLPWVPYRQYDYTLTATNGHWANKTFKASLGSGDPHIKTSNLPLVYVLPTSKDVVVGKPLTFTLYRLGGAGAGTAGHWRGILVGSGATTGTEVQFIQNGGSKFTFTPTRPGYWQADWAASPGYPWVLSGYYDPPVKRAPATPAPPAPTPTAPPTEPPLVATAEPSPTTTELPVATTSPSPLPAQAIVASPAPTAAPADVVSLPGEPSSSREVPGALVGLAALAVLIGLLAVSLATGRLRLGRPTAPATGADGSALGDPGNSA